MTSTTFIDKQTVIEANWLNDVNAIVYGLPTPSGSSLIGFIQSGIGAVARTVLDKGRESVSVLDFGADPTGVADSTVAIQAAIGASKKVYFPVGVYKVSTLKLTKGVHLFGDSNMFGYNPDVGAGLSFATLPTNVTVLHGTSASAPLFDLDSTSSGGVVGGLLIEGFSFYQTQASYTAPTVYPYVIDDVNSSANYWSGVTIRDCCFLNSYKGIRLQHATKYNIYSKPRNLLLLK
jgi:hypothetical protein